MFTHDCQIALTRQRDNRQGGAIRHSFRSSDCEIERKRKAGYLFDAALPDPIGPDGSKDSRAGLMRERTVVPIPDGLEYGRFHSGFPICAAHLVGSSPGRFVT